MFVKTAVLCFLFFVRQHTGLSVPATTTAAAATAAAAVSAEPEEVPSASASQAAARPTAGERACQ